MELHTEFIKRMDKKYPADYMFGCRGCVPIRQDLRDACGRIINLEKDRTAYKRDSEKYLEMLSDKKICPDCGTVDAVCDCPFG